MKKRILIWILISALIVALPAIYDLVVSATNDTFGMAIPYNLCICLFECDPSEFAEKAKVIAKNRMLLAKHDPEYFKTQYKKDLSRKKLYADADKN